MKLSYATALFLATGIQAAVLSSVRRCNSKPPRMCKKNEVCVGEKESNNGAGVASTTLYLITAIILLTLVLVLG